MESVTENQLYNEFIEAETDESKKAARVLLRVVTKYKTMDKESLRAFWDDTDLDIIDSYIKAIDHKEESFIRWMKHRTNGEKNNGQ